MMNKKYKWLKRSGILLAAVMVLSNVECVMAAGYKPVVVEKNNAYMNVDNYAIYEQSGKSHIIITDANIKKDDRIKNGLIDLCFDGEKVVSEQRVIHTYRWKYVGKVGKKYLLRGKVTKKAKNVVVNIKQVKKSGKIQKEYNLKINKRKIKTAKNVDIGIVNKSGRYLYYILTCSNDFETFYYYQKYDIKSNKLVFNNKINNDDDGSFIIDNGTLYSCSWEDEIFTKYDDYGKIKTTYQLPEGDHFISYEKNGEKDIWKCFDYDIVDNKIYCCNRNGIYKCDTAKGNSFELIYDASNDSLFNPAENEWCSIEYMQVMSNEDIYFFLSSEESFTGELCKIIYYSK